MTTTRPTTTIGVQPNTRLLRIERISPRSIAQWGKIEVHHEHGAWMIWINVNADFTLGTYIKLNDDGTIERVTVNPDGTEDIFVIKKKED